MSELRRLPIVAVLGSGAEDHGHPALAEAVGRLVAESGCHLLTGGGLGVMLDACRGFASVPDRRGVSLGVIPRSLAGDGPKQGYPNPWVEIAILTHLAGRLGPDGEDSRNAINVLTAHRILALPGRSGTRAEIRLARRYGKPVLGVLEADSAADDGGFLAFLDEMEIPRQSVRRLASGAWDLTGVRRFLL